MNVESNSLIDYFERVFAAIKQQFEELIIPSSKIILNMIAEISATKDVQTNIEYAEKAKLELNKLLESLARCDFELLSSSYAIQKPPTPTKAQEYLSFISNQIELISLENSSSKQAEIAKEVLSKASAYF